MLGSTGRDGVGVGIGLLIGVGFGLTGSPAGAGVPLNPGSPVEAGSGVDAGLGLDGARASDALAPFACRPGNPDRIGTFCSVSWPFTQKNSNAMRTSVTPMPMRLAMRLLPR